MKKIFVLLLIICSAQSCLAKTKIDPPPVSIGGGYVGTLPDPTEGFQKSEPKESAPLFESTDGFNDQNQLKPAPRNNPAFVNIIMKKDKTSQFTNDINYIIPILEKLETLVENKEDIQKVNAQSYFLKENLEFLRDKYTNRSEESYLSYKKLMQLNMHIQTVAQLRVEGQIYSPYLAYTDKGFLYSPNNIDKQLDYLLKEIQETLIILKEVH